MSMFRALSDVLLTLCFVFSSTVGVWSRIVRVPSGPLLRVEGTDIAISCNVSDYEGPGEQNFEWTFSPGSGPVVRVLSTWDDTFTDAALKGRVKAGDIQLQRTGNSEVLLRLRQLSSSDEGNYTCSTPSTDATVSGNYDDHVQLKGNKYMGTGQRRQMFFNC